MVLSEEKRLISPKPALQPCSEVGGCQPQLITGMHSRQLPVSEKKTQDGRRNFANHVSDNGCVPVIYKTLLQLNNEKTNGQRSEQMLLQRKHIPSKGPISRR